MATGATLLSGYSYLLAGISCCTCTLYWKISANLLQHMYSKSTTKLTCLKVKTLLDSI